MLDGVIKKSLGLIGKKAAKTVIIRTRTGIHTFGLKFPIDVIVLDKNFRVKLIKENLAPNRIYLWNLRYAMVIEMQEGAVKKSKTEVGDIIEIKL